MGALPRPDLPSGPHRDLNEALHGLHHRAGWPSLRALARAAGCSHTTVSHVFSSPRLPRWGVLELLVEIMDGDVDEVRRLWLAASEPETADAPTAAPLAGRRAERDVVRRHLAGGSGLLLVVGEGGIGKSALVSAAAGDAHQVRLVVGRGLRLSSDIPFLPVAAALRAAFAVEDGAWLASALSAAPAYVTESLTRLLPELDGDGRSPAPDDGWSRQRLMSAISLVLRGLCELHPAAFLVEDVHWADPATLDLLEHLTVHDPGVPLVATTRGDDPTVAATNREWVHRLRRTGAVDVVELGPLTLTETGRQVELLGGPTDADRVARIYRRTRGQPLFTEQLVSYGDEAGLPSVLEHLLEQRLQGATPEEWRVLVPLALAGRPLAFEQLAEVAEAEADVLVARLRRLITQRLVAPSETTSIELSHPLLGEVVVDGLAPGEAAPVHRRLARALGRTDTPPGQVARHWQLAGDDAEELLWRMRAARVAELRFASTSTALHWQRVIELWPDPSVALGDPPTTLVSAYFAAMDALDDAAQSTLAAELAQRAMALEATMTPEERAGLYVRSADYVADTDNEAALLFLDRAVALLSRRPDSVTLHRTLQLRSGILGQLGRLTASLEAARLAAEVSRRLDDPGLVRTSLMSLAWHEAIVGEREAARTHALEAAGLASWRENPMADIQLSTCHTDLLLISGSPVSDVEAAARPGLEAAERWGIDSRQASALRANVAEALRRAGAIGDAGRIVDPWTDGTILPHRWPLSLERAVLDVTRGRPEEARAGFRAVGEVDLPSVLARADVTQYTALGNLWLGRPEEALSSLLDVLDEMERTEVAATIGPLLVLAARAAADVADDTGSSAARRRELHAAVQARRAPARPDPVRTSGSLALGYAWQAEVARLTLTGDVRPWLDSAAQWDRRQRPHEAAYARWRAAEQVIASGRTADTLLRRAAHDAREHVPLGRAIRATSARSPRR